MQALHKLHLCKALERGAQTHNGALSLPVFAYCLRLCWPQHLSTSHHNMALTLALNCQVQVTREKV